MLIGSLTDPVAPADLDRLASLLIECVAGGASIGFLEPLSPRDAAAYWLKVVGDLSGGQRFLRVIRDAPGRGILGSAQLVLEAKETGRHRAEVQKVLVRPTHRRRGIARSLMADLEALALARGVRLLYLDTSEGRSGARELYEALGYHYAGGIPGWALDPDGTPAKNAIFYKILAT